MANVKINTTNTTDGYQQPVDPNTTGVLAGGFYPQNSTSNDAAAGVTRDSSGNLVLTDAAVGSKTLTELRTATNATNVAITNDTTTAAARYPTFVSATSGNAGANVSSTKLTFIPATGTLAASAMAATTFTGALSGTATNATNVAVGNDTSTATPIYPALVGAASGNNPVKVTSTKLTFTPASGILGVSGVATAGITVENGSTSADNVTITASTTGAALRVTQNGTGEAIRVEDSTNPDSTSFIVDANGQVGVGGAPVALFSVIADGFPSPVVCSAGTSAGSYLSMQRARGSLASPTIVSDGDYMGGLTFAGYDGAAYQNCAAVYGIVGGTPGTNDMPGTLVFSTAADGSTTLSERMKIDAAGAVTISTASSAPTLTVNGGIRARGGGPGSVGVSDNGYAFTSTNGGDNDSGMFCSADGVVDFYANAVKSVTVNTTELKPGSDNAFKLGISGTRWSEVWAANGTIQTSDARQKTEVTNSDLGLAFVESLRPVSYKWLVGQNVLAEQADGTKALTPQPGVRVHYGFISQEVEQALAGKDFAGFIHDSGTDEYGLRYAEFIAPLTKAVQELSAQVRALQAEVAALKGV